MCYVGNHGQHPIGGNHGRQAMGGNHRQKKFVSTPHFNFPNTFIQCQKKKKKFFMYIKFFK